MKSILYIGNKLSEYGLTVTSIDTLGLLLENEGYKMQYASTKKNKISRMLDMFYKTISKFRHIDYVLIDTYSTSNFWYTFFISQLCRILKLKYIPILHGGNLPNRLNNNPFLCKMIFKNAYKNIAPSNYLFKAFNDKNYAEIIYIPNTIELQNYHFKIRKIIEPKLLWVRSFTAIYNPEMAIKVLLELKSEFPNAELCMIGPDKDGTLPKIKQLANNLKLKVNFTGKLSKKDWTKLSEDYDIFINTTHYDNTPVSVLEALAMGIPVVSTNVGGIPFLLENRKNAILINDDDVSGMVSAIKEIINNSQLKDHLINNGLNLIQEFDWERVKNKWVEILQ